MRGYDEESVSPLIETGGPKIFVTDAVMLDVSATEIRRQHARIASMI